MNSQASKARRKRPKKATKKRAQRRRGGELRVINSRMSTGFPDSEVAIIRYSDEIAIAPGAAYGQYTYRGNSCFDPDESGIGHQPMYFDQYAAVYSKYKVISCSCSVTGSNYNASASAVLAIIPSSEIPTLTSYAIAMEQPYAKRTELLPISTRGGVQSTVASRMSTRRILGLTSAQFASEDYSATTGATPSSVWYWNIAAFDVSAVSVRLLVDLDYKVIFYDRRAPSPSYALKVVKTPEQQQERQEQKRAPVTQTPVVNMVTAVSPVLFRA